jgi:hypothetical protein
MHLRLARWTLALACLLAAAPARADEPRWAVGTSAWMVANAFPDPPHFYYVEVDRRVTDRDEVVIEPVTWTYDAPIGIPYGDSYGDATQDYPGFVRSIGVGVGWRRYLYRGLNASARSIHFLQLYQERGREQTTGYQLFLQARAGWRLARRGFWIEPSVACNWWPIEVGRPASFEAMDDRWPTYFLLEPWLNAGWRW